ncbi:MAG: FAD-dependent thymidylate synthase [Candidatus Baltobacteraceae bacterium]
MTGDSLITTILPASGLPSYIPIKKLYERQSWENYRGIQLRVYDEEKEAFTTAGFRDIFFTGAKPVYEITLADGKKIKCTKEHKFLTRDGFRPLEDVIGLEMVGDRAAMTKTGFLGTNGVPCHQDYEWLANARRLKPPRSLMQIARAADTSTHTIRKWLRIHQLQYSPIEVAQYTPIWNKGKFGYKTSLKHSPEHLAAIRAARSGPKSNWWKGGVERSDRLRIADWCGTIRRKKLAEASFQCLFCGSHEKLELDHIEPVYSRPDLAYEYKNIQVLCKACHDKKHAIHGDPKMWARRGRGNTLRARWTQVMKVEYLGIQDTYDIEVDHPSHNYVANKIVVHNSQRYAPVQKIEEVSPRSQDLKNRQSSHDDLTAETKEWFAKAQDEHFAEAKKLYDEALAKGIAKESARFLLPMASGTTIYMKGTVRDWVHYINLRADPGTQLEHREIALAAKELFIEQLPVVAEALGWERSTVYNGH